MAALAAVAPVSGMLDAFLADRVDDLCALDPALDQIGRAVADLVHVGGKRLRPAFVYWGHRAAGADHDPAVLHAAAAVELLHTFALIHDDVMDRSNWRRGRPAVHAALAQAHVRQGMLGDPDWFGVGGAILAGDLAFVWSDRLFDEAPLPAPALDRARRVFTELRVEVMAGQFLDLRLAGLVAATEDDALRVALLKSGRYTVTRPLQLGAALGGGDQRLDAALIGYGDAIGLAFQLRDDVLGLFGDPETTGKGAVEDLREGKRTLLVLRTLELCRPDERDALSLLLGNAELDQRDADWARGLVRDCGALASVERLLDQQQSRARGHLAVIPAPARDALEELADLASFRVV
jgi:geranylgeranyl diphosphate synthase type I